MRVEPVTRYRFADGSPVDLSADLPRAMEALEAWSPGAGADWARFLGDVRGDVARVGARSSPASRRGRRACARRAALGPARPRCASSRGARCARLARAHARDPRLRMVIERFATYAGADPRRAPGGARPRRLRRARLRRVAPARRRLRDRRARSRARSRSSAASCASTRRPRGLRARRAAGSTGVRHAGRRRRAPTGSSGTATPLALDAPARGARRGARRAVALGLRAHARPARADAGPAAPHDRLPAPTTTPSSTTSSSRRRPVRDPTLYVSVLRGDRPGRGAARRRELVRARQRARRPARAACDGYDEHLLERLAAARARRRGADRAARDAARRPTSSARPARSAARSTAPRPHGRLGTLRRPGPRVRGVPNLLPRRRHGAPRRRPAARRAQRAARGADRRLGRPPAARARLAYSAWAALAEQDEDDLRRRRSLVRARRRGRRRPRPRGRPGSRTTPRRDRRGRRCCRQPRSCGDAAARCGGTPARTSGSPCSPSVPHRADRVDDVTAPAAGPPSSPSPRPARSRRAGGTPRGSRGPPARWIAPSTPPPPSSELLRRVDDRVDLDLRDVADPGGDHARGSFPFHVPVDAIRPEAREELLGVPALRRGCGARPSRCAVARRRRRPGRRRASATARTSPGARPATRRSRPRRAGRALGELARRRQDRAVEGAQAARADRRAGEDRDRLAVGRRRARAGEQRVGPPHAPRARSGSRRTCVALRAPSSRPARGHRRRRAGTRRAPPRPPTPRTAPSGAGPRSASSSRPRPVPSSCQNRRPGVAAQHRAVEPHAGQSLRRGGARVADRGGRRRALDLEYAAAALAGYLLGSIPVALLVARRHGVDLRRPATATRAPGTRSSSSARAAPGRRSSATG